MRVWGVKCKAERVSAPAEEIGEPGVGLRLVAGRDISISHSLNRFFCCHAGTTNGSDSWLNPADVCVRNKINGSRIQNRGAIVSYMRIAALRL